MGAPAARTLILVYLGLMALLALTVLGAGARPEGLATTISLGIALAKAALILAFFMRLRYRSLRTRVVALAAFLWVAILFALTFGDYLTRGAIGVLGK